jgi:hypothetical protein
MGARGRSNGRRLNGAGNGRRRVRHRELPWESLNDEQLLDLRLCDLELAINGTVLEERIERLYTELTEKKLTFRPHCWLSSEWFSPDGVPGIAIPFYLAHPRLMMLEEREVLDVEGGTPRSCMQLLRHEAAHALDSAYALHRRKRWREVFGRYGQPYPRFYQPKPYSKSFVLHLDRWYAQSHPAEDFAETFAVWVDPSSRWRKRYRGWGALKKLLYVDELMREIAGGKPQNRSRERVEPLSSLRVTLRRHYEDKKKRYGLDYPSFYDRDLRRLFPSLPESEKHGSAAVFLRKVRPELRRAVAYWTGEYQYTIDQVLLEMIDRCDELDLRLDRDPEQAKRDALLMVAITTMNYLHAGHHRLAR